MNRTLGIASLLIMSAVPAGAQGQGGDNPVDAVAACRAITDTTARLACFDTAAAALVAARDRKDVVVLDQAEVKKTRRSLFGFNLPRIKLFGDGDTEQEKELETTVESARALGYGKWALRTAEGANWQTTESAPFTLRSGQNIVIRRAALGSYMLKLGNERAVRAVRVN